MSLNIIWFVLIGILFTGYFILEGFDLGVGILHPFVAKTDTERRMVINTIGPHWDGNEVWLITAGGAMFAAFPNWYATLFSGFYLPLFLMLVGLILRGVALEFRSKNPNPRWRALWDWSLFAGSLIPALLWGVAFANFLRGVPVDAFQNYVGGFWNLLNPYALFAGLLTTTGFTLQGSLFLLLKTEGVVYERVKSLTFKIWMPVVVLLGGVILLSNYETDLLTKEGITTGIIPVLSVLTLLAAGFFIYKKQYAQGFILNSLTILLVTVLVFMGLFPRVLVSSLNPDWSLTIFNASSSPYTLQVMSIIALIFVPIVLIYQGWTYWVFRKRISDDPKKMVY
ncbi:cytochrome d ubiquinol oxidase subunit II [Leptolinea tardivitalis]|uniref:Cytochrome d ubiquinol oxidase subunit 2 n=1 Tax=Leptolinea tardivitalis TaxID=229920 RepID=A0A0P6X0L7_9CHLR|nr:cytochrome d ubiquinol oxidase subunit II [Leptolinea tardivitalis]KPL72781.1 cytochrome d ubiquinol oxidase subunit 2 [Leptolinea tardivitalis]GAP20863.1 cytochrome bd-I ubiquinol oxidase subunit 2 apoprotein [Leptolinea tardivitalis]